MKKNFTFFLFAALCLSLWGGQLKAQQYCGDIENQGDTLLRIRPSSVLPGQSYQWYKNGEPIPGANQPFLRIRGANPQDFFTLQTIVPTEKLRVNEFPTFLIGKTLDPKFEPIAGVEVRLEEATAQTNAQGEFMLSLPQNPASRLALQFNKSGYFRIIRALTPTEGDTLYLTQILIPLGEPFELDTRFEGTLFNPLALVTLPPNSLQDERGAAYSGPYKGYLCSFSPSDPRIAGLMPGGDFMGLSAQNDTVHLQTYGFLGVELRDTANRPLQLRIWNSARVAQAIEKDMQAGAPSQMPSWRFDPIRGYWVEVNAPARKSSDNKWYETQINRTGFWNWGRPTASCSLKAKIAINCPNFPIGGMGVEVYSPTSKQRWEAFVDNDGNFASRVLANALLYLIYQSKDTATLAPLPPNQIFEPPVFIGDSNAGLGVKGIALCNKDSATVHFYAPEGASTAYMNSTQTLRQSSPIFAGDHRNAPHFAVILQNPANLCKPIDTLKAPVYAAPAFEALCDNSPVAPTEARTLEASFRNLPESANWRHIAQNTSHFNALLLHFPCLKSVRASQLNLNELPAAIGKHTQLQELNLSNNKLAQLPETIGNLAQLQTLTLSNNQFTNFPQVIANLTQLKTLQLDNNQLATAPPAINNLTQLQKLYLNNNQFANFPQTVLDLTQLIELYLNNNLLSDAPQTIGNLARLQTLTLSHNRITNLPETIGNLTQLQTFLLNNNQITALPPTIGNLTQLKWLNLNHNQLTHLPESLGNLHQIEWLWAANNQLMNLPQSLGNLTQLRELWLNNNQLTSLPESFGNLTQLQELWLNDNQLTRLPQTISNLSGNLRVLNLKNNPISEEHKRQIREWLPNTSIFFN